MPRGDQDFREDLGHRQKKSAPPVSGTLVLISKARRPERKTALRETGLSPGLGFRPQGLGPEDKGGDREADTQDELLDVLRELD